MKKIFGFLMLAALCAGMASCQNDETPGTTGEDVNAALQFSFASPKGAFVTRAGEIAKDNEWNIATLDVYAVNDTGAVTLLTAGTPKVGNTPATGHYQITPDPATDTDATNREFVIKFHDEWVKDPLHLGKEFDFYFVANDATSTEGDHTDLDETAIADFKEALTEPLAVATGSEVTRIAAAGEDLLFSAVVEDIIVAGKKEIAGKLTRREARFDIENSSIGKDDEFVVTNILISNAHTQGYIFGAASGAALSSIPTADYAEINTGLTNPVSGVGGDYTDVNSDGKRWVAQSVFYLYPTTIGKNNEAADAKDGTQILIEGTFKGQTEYLPVVVSEDTDINANTRYIIFLDPDFGTRVVVTDDWDYDENTDIWEAAPGENAAQATFAGWNKVGAGSIWDEATLDLSTTAGAANPAKLDFTATSPMGTEYILKHSVGGNTVDDTAVVKMTRALTTTRAFTTQAVDTYEIVIPVGDTAIEATLTIRSNSNPDHDKVIKLHRVLPAPGTAKNAQDLLLYFASDGTLSLSAWDYNEVKQNTLAFFKFGSVVGFDLESSADTWDSSDVRFNPTTTPESTWNASSTTGGYSLIPNFVDWLAANGGYVEGIHRTDNFISSSTYATGANAKLGYGDPCMFVGYKSSDFSAETTVEEFDAIIAAARFRLPTVHENIHFVGAQNHPDYADGWKIGDEKIVIHQSATPNGTTTLNYFLSNTSEKGTNGGFFPGSTTSTLNRERFFLPTGSNRGPDGAPSTNPSIALYWSSSVYNAIYGIYLEFHSPGISVTAVNDTNNNPWEYGFAVRCVPKKA